MLRFVPIGMYINKICILDNINKMEEIIMKNETHTNIRIRKETKQKFDELGKYGESADDILNRLIYCFKETHTGSKVHNYFRKLELADPKQVEP